MPGHGGVGVLAGQLGLDVAVELGEALVAGQLGSAARPEDAAEAVAIAHSRSWPSAARRRRSFCLASWSVLYTAPRVESSRSASTSIGTSLRAIATSTLPLVRGELLLDRQSQRSEQLGRLGVLAGSRRAVGDQLPAVAVDRDLAVLPEPPACPDAGLEQGELVGPGGEAAGAAEVVELREHGHERVVGALVGQVVGVGGGSAPADLEARRSQEQRVQLRDRLVALAARRAQPGQPFA